jgi:hypothetical protein
MTSEFPALYVFAEGKTLIKQGVNLGSFCMMRRPAAASRQRCSNIMSKGTSTVIRVLTGILAGGAGGFVAGVVGWLVFFYVFFMLPEGTPLRAMDQGAILIVFTGPLGAVIGGVIGGIVFGLWFGPTKTNQARAKQKPPPIPVDNSDTSGGPPSVS